MERLIAVVFFFHQSAKQKTSTFFHSFKNYYFSDINWHFVYWPQAFVGNDRMLVHIYAVLYNVYNNLQIYHIIWSWLLKVKSKIKVKNKAWNRKRCDWKEWDQSTFELHFLANQKRNMGKCGAVCQQPFVVKKKSSSNSFSSTNHQKQSQCLFSPSLHIHTHTFFQLT